MSDLDPSASLEAKTAKRLTCAISGRERPRRELVRFDTLRPALADKVREEHPGLLDEDMVDRQEINRYRNAYVEGLLRAEHGEFTELDRQVAASIANQDTIAENVEDGFEERRTFGEHLSDVLASFGGSWAFLVSFGVLLVVWMSVNLYYGDPRAFDPYPFILLNLVLSTLAAVQGPVIMMSQRRQEQKDRLRSLNDYRINLKAELEIRHLHEKLDHLITNRWQRLAEIQQVQLEIMQDGLRRK